jgi:hypothetical protein
MKDRKIKQVLSVGWYQQDGGGYRERVKEDEYGGYRLYSCMRMEKLDLLKLF